jgi:L-ascorbate metabolism protein UlaG (beta-lactamase superfamily)
MVHMDIKYFGHSSFFIKSKDARLVTDPFNSEMLGFRFPKTEADIVTVSHDHKDHNNIEAISNNPLIINMPGEYEKNGIRIFGYPSFHDKKKGSERGENVLFKIEAENISLLHCGDLGEMPDDKLLDEIGEVDILFVPVGGVWSLNSGEAVTFVKKIEPSIIIPMHYRTSKHDPKQFGTLAHVEEFLKKMGSESIQPITKLTVKKEDLQDEMKVVVMDVS